VLRLRQKVRGDPFRIASRRENNGFRRASGKINGAIAADELLGGGDEPVSRAADFFDTRNGFCPVSEGGNRLRSSDAGNLCHAQQISGGEKSGIAKILRDTSVFLKDQKKISDVLPSYAAFVTTGAIAELKKPGT